MTDEKRLAHLYWHCIRAAAAGDPADACFRYGVSAEMAGLVASLTSDEIDRMVDADLVLMRPTVSPIALRNLLKIDPAARVARRIFGRMAAHNEGAINHE